MNGPQNEQRAALFKFAPCVDSDVDMIPEQSRRAADALELCGVCARTTECFDDFRRVLAANPNTFGVWGGHFIPPVSHPKPSEPRRRDVLTELGLIEAQPPGTAPENTVPRRRTAPTVADAGRCKRGHDPDSRYLRADGYIGCRTCNTQRAHKHRTNRHNTLIGATA